MDTTERTPPMSRHRRTLNLVALAGALVVLALAALSITTAVGHARPACSPACKTRVLARVHRAHVEHRVKHKLQTIAPYRAWLGSTGACESGTDTNLHHGLGAIGGNGAFRGRYQFTFTTWARAGGHGDPAAASWLEQAYRAVLWRQRIGNPHTSAGWPVCG